MTNRVIMKNLSNLTILSRKLNRFVIICLCFICFSCNEPTIVYEQYQVIENALWEKDKEYYFTFEITDTSVTYDLELEVRNNNLYPYQNLWLFCSEELPIGPLQKDTVEFMLADDYGKWLGRGISLFQSCIPIRKNYTFPSKGQYTFSFRQGMRNDALPGIQEIGFRVGVAKD